MAQYNISAQIFELTCYWIQLRVCRTEILPVGSVPELLNPPCKNAQPWVGSRQFLHPHVLPSLHPAAAYQYSPVSVRGMEWNVQYRYSIISVFMLARYTTVSPCMHGHILNYFIVPHSAVCWSLYLWPPSVPWSLSVPSPVFPWLSWPS